MAQPDMVPENPAGIYTKFKFTPAPYQQFPTAVPMLNGKVSDTPYDKNNKLLPVVTVANQEEYDALVAGSAEVQEGTTRLRGSDDVLADLLARAEVLDAKVDPTWDVEKIEAVIEAVELKMPDLDRRKGGPRLRAEVDAFKAANAPKDAVI